MRCFLDGLLDWPHVSALYPPSPDPAWKEPTRKAFTFQWDAPLGSSWNKQLAPLFERLFLKRHPEWCTFAKEEPTKIKGWFRNRARSLIKKRNASLTAESPSAKRTQKAKNARQTRKGNVSGSASANICFLIFIGLCRITIIGYLRSIAFKSSGPSEGSSEPWELME